MDWMACAQHGGMECQGGGNREDQERETIVGVRGISGCDLQKGPADCGMGRKRQTNA
jgi:hypothetical protein